MQLLPNFLMKICLDVMVLMFFCLEMIYSQYKGLTKYKNTWQISSLRVAEFWAKFSIKSEFDCMMHKKLISSSLFVGAVYFRASIFTGSGFIPSELLTVPQNFVSLLPNLHLLGFNIRPTELIPFNTSWIALIYYEIILVEMIRSSWIKWKF